MSVLNDYEGFVHKSRYARWIEKENRRETWKETVSRLCDYWAKKYKKQFPYKKVFDAIYNRDVMPSMRALMTAGEALDRDQMAGYNCSYIVIDHPRAFDEVMYILMCGTGVGFSVETKYVAKLPQVPEELHPTETTIVVADSRVGWASGLRELLSLLYAGKIPRWDLSKLRPAGSRLRVFGGRSSGPEPLDAVFRFCVERFRGSRGRRLTSVECHDIVCKIADAVIVGGVRRSALISLSDLGDVGMAKAKTGQWWVDHPHRALSNNSAVFDSKPNFESFLTEWKNLYESKSGERGIFNRMAAKEQAASSGRRDFDRDFGTNPCGEIILRPMGLCNLTEVVVRPHDTFRTLKRKVEVAAILGTFQSTLTNFRYVRKTWQTNAEEERLLGVSLTGIFDNLALCTAPRYLQELKNHAIATNKKVSKQLGISMSHAVTCVKPSGTVSQLASCSSGIHPAFSDFYIRRVRNDNKDPLTNYLQAAGVPSEPEQHHRDTVTVFSFPTKAPEGSKKQSEVSALEHLRVYSIVREHWCEHNPSTTIYYSDNEFLDIGGYVWNNFNKIGGLSFLPRSDHIYAQAPYEAITEEQYKELVGKFPKLDWDTYHKAVKEETDTTIGSQELACMGQQCDI